MSWFHWSAFEPLVEFLFPRICYRCGTEGHTWCQLADDVTLWPLCFSCRRNYHPDAGQPGCKESLPLVWQGPYHDGDLRSALYDWKYRGYWAVSEAWASDLADRLRRLLPASPDQGLLVPIPLHSRRQLARGYNQAAVLAKQISHAIGWPTCELLLRNRRTETQAKLPDSKRLANVAGAFALIPQQAPRRKPVWLVDDIVTTGATIEAARQTLVDSGWDVRGVIAVAAARGEHRE